MLRDGFRTWKSSIFGATLAGNGSPEAAISSPRAPKITPKLEKWRLESHQKNVIEKIGIVEIGNTIIYSLPFSTSATLPFRYLNPVPGASDTTGPAAAVHTTVVLLLPGQHSSQIHATDPVPAATATTFRLDPFHRLGCLRITGKEPHNNRTMLRPDPHRKPCS